MAKRTANAEAAAKQERKKLAALIASDTENQLRSLKRDAAIVSACAKHKQPIEHLEVWAGHRPTAGGSCVLFATPGRVMALPIEQAQNYLAALRSGCVYGPAMWFGERSKDAPPTNIDAGYASWSDEKNIAILLAAHEMRSNKLAEARRLADETAMALRRAVPTEIMALETEAGEHRLNWWSRLASAIGRRIPRPTSVESHCGIVSGKQVVTFGFDSNSGIASMTFESNAPASLVFLRVVGAARAAAAQKASEQ